MHTFDDATDFLPVSVNEVESQDTGSIVVHPVRLDLYPEARNLHLEFLAVVLEADDVPELFGLLCARISYTFHCHGRYLHIVRILVQVFIELTLFLVRARSAF